MNDEYLKKALEALDGNKNVLVNLAAKRAGEISRGSRKLVDVKEDTLALDVALLEIAEGKVTYKVN